MIGTAFFDDEVPGKRPGVMCSRNLSVLDFVKCFLLAAKASAEKTPRVHFYITSCL